MKKTVLLIALFLGSTLFANENLPLHIEKELQTFIPQLNKTLPKKLDQTTSLIKVVYLNKTLTYVNQLDLPKKELEWVSMEAFKKQLSQKNLKTLCSDPNFTYFFKYRDFTVEYSYIDSLKEPLFDFKLSLFTQCK